MSKPNIPKHKPARASQHATQAVAGLTQALEAPNIGTNKIFINVNGNTSKLETNQNAKVQYKLNNPFKLNVGDKVTLYQAFVNEAGLNTDTVTFQEDIQSTVKFLYYMPSQLFMNAEPTLTVGSETGVPHPRNGQVMQNDATNDAGNRCLTFAQYQDFASFPSQSFLCREPTHENDASGSRNDLLTYRRFFGEVSVPFSDVFGGDTGQPYYLFENYHGDHMNGERVVGSNAYIKPAYGEVTINIKAGNYEASSLAKNITEQFNGAFVDGANNSNYLTDRLFNPESANYAGVNTSNPFGNQTGKATTKIAMFGKNSDSYDSINYYNRADMRMDIRNNVLFYNCPDHFMGDLFVNPDGLELWVRNTSNTQISKEYPINSVHFSRQTVTLDGSMPHTWLGGTIDETNTIGSPDNVPTFGFDPNEDRMIQYISNNLLLNVNPLPIEKLDFDQLGELAPERYCGTHSFTLSYSDDKANRYSIKNLHEPYKLPSITKTNDASNFSAQQATKYNTSNSTGCVNYPIDASMGIMINNFGFEQVQQTNKYIELKKALDDATNTSGVGSRPQLIAEYNLNTAKFTDFFPTERDAKIAWSKTLWSRLGFKYEQLGDINNSVETVKTIKPFGKGGGFFSATQERLNKWNLGEHKLKGIITHNDFDFSDIQACANLGANPVQINNNNVNMYDSVSFSKPQAQFETFITSAIQQNPLITSTFSMSLKNEFSVMSSSQSIDADELPDLNAGNSYYLITSDIVKPNGLDANGDPMNLIGVMSKENSSNDTIYSVDGIPNIITEEKLVSELSIEVRNPDNSLVPDSIIGKSSGFILMVEKAINPNVMEVNSI
jgi:hypothetical protein